MKVICFEGYSDDTFGWFNQGNVNSGDDYDNCASGEPIMWVVESESTDECMLVFGQYCPELATGWMIGVAKFDEKYDCPLPAWTMGFARGRKSYSPRLVIEVPDDAIVTNVVNREGTRRG